MSDAQDCDGDSGRPLVPISVELAWLYDDLRRLGHHDCDDAPPPIAGVAVPVTGDTDDDTDPHIVEPSALQAWIATNRARIEAEKDDRDRWAMRGMTDVDIDCDGDDLEVSS